MYVRWLFSGANVEIGKLKSNSIQWISNEITYWKIKSNENVFGVLAKKGPKMFTRKKRTTFSVFAYTGDYVIPRKVDRVSIFPRKNSGVYRKHTGNKCRQNQMTESRLKQEATQEYLFSSLSVALDLHLTSLCMLDLACSSMHINKHDLCAKHKIIFNGCVAVLLNFFPFVRWLRFLVKLEFGFEFEFEFEFQSDVICSYSFPV